MMNVLYYTNSSFADFALEIVHKLKTEVKLHLVIELAPENKSGTVITTKELDGKPVVCSPEEILTTECLQLLQPYFDGCASVHFYIQTNKRTFTLDNLKSARQLVNYIRANIKPDIFHFDTITQRSLGMVPYLYFRFRKKIVIAIHDPVPHSREGNWRLWITNKLYFPLAGSFLLYSEYSKRKFLENYPPLSVQTAILRMKPYLLYRRFLKKSYSSDGEYVLFFGRISYYKGIDVFLKAIPRILERFPGQKFMIAGSNFPGYEVDNNLIEPIRESLVFKNHFIKMEELANLIHQSALVVCPYKEATQSGVLMTAFACSRGVVATEVGAFPEYIRNGENGILCEEGNEEALASAIINLLEEKKYRKINDLVNAETGSNDWGGELKQVLIQYQGML